MGLFDRLKQWVGGSAEKPSPPPFTPPPPSPRAPSAPPDFSRAFTPAAAAMPPHARVFETPPPPPPDKRLRSHTFRSKSRTLRKKAMRPDRLAKLSLPAWKDEAALAAALDLPLKQLRHYSIHSPKDGVRHYVQFSVPKRSGGMRTILAPKKKLKAIQRKLNELLVAKLPVHAAAHGFLPGHSVLTNAQPHSGKAVVVKMDLAHCFPTLHFGRIRAFLVRLGYSFEVATVLGVLMTECERQPVEAYQKDQVNPFTKKVVCPAVCHVPLSPRYAVQGAPTSPGLCNALLRKMDARMIGVAKALGFTYTRYADDLTFSSDDKNAAVGRLLGMAGQVVREEGFAVKREKTRVMRPHRCQRVTGVVVNQGTGLSREERRKMRAGIHRIKTGHPEAPKEDVLRGKLAYLRMLNPGQAATLAAKWGA